MEMIIGISIATIIQTLVSGGLLLCATRLTGEHTSFVQMSITALCASVVRWIPLVGTILSFVVLLLLVRRFTTASGMGIFLIVVVSNGLGLVLSLCLMGLIS